jgi:hypothetical protein
MRNPFKRAKKGTRTDLSQQQTEGSTSARIDTGAAESENRVDRIEGRLVVMGHESMFSDEVIGYAIDMAKRMSYEILALNSAPLSCDSFGLFSTSRNKLCQEFRSISEKNAAAFRQIAETERVPFVHVVKFDEPEQALASLQNEYDQIEFVIADEQPQVAMDRAAESNRPKRELLVYSMI